MKTIRPIIRLILATLFLLMPFSADSQKLLNINIADTTGLDIVSMTLSDSTTLILIRNKPIISFLLDDKYYSTNDVDAIKEGIQYSLVYENKLKAIFKASDFFSSYWDGEFIFENISTDTISLSNVVPFGTDNESVYITGEGPWDLARAWLFRPGYRPVRVILPDNAWEMGYSSFRADRGFSVCAIARRKNTEGGQKQRYQTVLPPKAKVSYAIYADVFKGECPKSSKPFFITSG